MKPKAKTKLQRPNNVKRRNNGNPDKIKGQGFHTNPERINKNGRPKKWISELVDQGYSRSQINDCISALLSFSIKELKTIAASTAANKYTAFEQVVAKVILKAKESGSIHGIEIMLARVHGGPNVKMAVDIGMNARSNKRIYLPHNNRDQKDPIQLDTDEAKQIMKAG